MQLTGMGGSLVSHTCIDTKALLLAMTSRNKDGNHRNLKKRDNDNGVVRCQGVQS